MLALDTVDDITEVVADLPQRLNTRGFRIAHAYAIRKTNGPGQGPFRQSFPTFKTRLSAHSPESSNLHANHAPSLRIRGSHGFVREFRRPPSTRLHVSWSAGGILGSWALCITHRRWRYI